MPDFVLFKSEFALKTENRQQAAEIARLRADNARLKAIVGEAVEEVAPARVLLPAQGEAFKSGNCTISMMPAKGAPIAPAATGTPRQVVAAPAGQALRSVPASQVVLGTQGEANGPRVAVAEEATEDSAVLRFRMMEMNS